MLGITKGPSIVFTYNGKNYRVSMRAYDKDRIVLPNKTVLYVNGWYESYPPIPSDLEKVDHKFTTLDVDAIAKEIDAVVATELE